LNDVDETGQGTNDNAGVGTAVDPLSHPFPIQVLERLRQRRSGFNRDHHNLALKADGSLWMLGRRR